MKDNKGTTILLTVIGIATLLVAVVGATFAYFTAGVKDSDDSVSTDVIVNSATVGTITFDHGNIIDLCDETDETLEFQEGAACVIYPGAKETKTFTVKADDKSTTPIEYIVYLEILANTFKTSQLGYKVSATTIGESELLPEGAGVTSRTVSTNLPTALETYTPMDSVSNEGKFAYNETVTNKVEIGKATLGTYGALDTWTLDVTFADPGTEDNTDQGAVIEARIVVEAASKFTTGGTLYEGNAQ